MNISNNNNSTSHADRLPSELPERYNNPNFPLQIISQPFVLPHPSQNCPVHGLITETLSLSFTNGDKSTYCIRCIQDLLNKKIPNLDNPQEIKPEIISPPEIKLSRYDILKKDSSGNG